MKKISRIGIMLLIFTAVVLLSSGPMAFAESLPSVITTGLKALTGEDAKKGVEAWLVGSPLEGNEAVLKQAETLNRIKDVYGAYTGHDTIKSIMVTETSRVDYIQLNFEKGPLFTYFLSFKSGDKWVVINFKFNTQPEAILPLEILTNQV